MAANAKGYREVDAPMKGYIHFEEFCYRLSITIQYLRKLINSKKISARFCIHVKAGVPGVDDGNYIQWYKCGPAVLKELTSKKREEAYSQMLQLGFDKDCTALAGMDQKRLSVEEIKKARTPVKIKKVDLEEEEEVSSEEEEEAHRILNEKLKGDIEAQREKNDYEQRILKATADEKEAKAAKALNKVISLEEVMEVLQVLVSTLKSEQIGAVPALAQDIVGEIFNQVISKEPSLSGKIDKLIDGFLLQSLLRELLNQTHQQVADKMREVGDSLLKKQQEPLLDAVGN